MCKIILKMKEMRRKKKNTEMFLELVVLYGIDTSWRTSKPLTTRSLWSGKKSLFGLDELGDGVIK